MSKMHCMGVGDGGVRDKQWPGAWRGWLAVVQRACGITEAARCDMSWCVFGKIILAG